MFTKSTRFIIIDTETANTLPNNDMSDVLIYDIGWAICDKDGNIYETASYINSDIFYREKDLMQSAYYAAKLPQYMEDIAAGQREVANIWEIRRAMLSAMERHNVTYAAAYNARFDAKALNRTISYITKSFSRYFYPFGTVEWLDIMKMAQDAVVSSRHYKQWATDRNYLQKNGAPRKTAEMLYQYMTGEEQFTEEHTGLADVLIEVEIMAFCFSERDRRKIKMRTKLYENPLDFPPQTDFQRELMRSIRDRPTLY